ncbi:hypothetical protein PPACK8108_LOCUS4202 [Phakopsora pachyrhizi]|uniref:Uncharacterized protein n=1 Tax=Phakopsora pachyrhizi TaxID=170000 RepID=A0AAV0AMT6_PHAPC|nr:hypothetical protein PPACK8108_LOCUS4202 [Phakopsora pachyrhizi]
MMITPFQSNSRQWILSIKTACKDFAEKSLAESDSSHNNLDHYIRSVARASPPIVVPSFAQDSYQRACSENLLEDECCEASYNLDPKLVSPIKIPIGRSNLMPLYPAYINSDSSFERQDPQEVISKFEIIDSEFLSIAENLYRLREEIDYWLPTDNCSKLDTARSKWFPSQLAEQARLRTIHELNNIQMTLTDHIQATSNAIGELREGTFGGRLNNKSVTNTKLLFEKLKDFRKTLLKLGRPAGEISRSTRSMSNWLNNTCLPTISEIREPYQADRFYSTELNQTNIVEVFKSHIKSIFNRLSSISTSFNNLSKVFEILVSMTKTIVESLHKIMFDVHSGQTTCEFIASWLSRWERVTFILMVQILSLPAISLGLQRSFPGMEVEFVYLH